MSTKYVALDCLHRLPSWGEEPSRLIVGFLMLLRQWMLSSEAYHSFHSNRREIRALQRNNFTKSTDTILALRKDIHDHLSVDVIECLYKRISTLD
jgi:hypothetical protein